MGPQLLQLQLQQQPQHQIQQQLHLKPQRLQQQKPQLHLTTSTTSSSTSTTTTASSVVNANGWFYLPGYLKGSVPLYQYTHNFPGYQLQHGSNTISNSLIPFWQTNPFLIRGRPQP